MRTPLAWLNLLHNKPRLIAALGGVAFAVVLMFIEMGFLNGLYDSQTEVVRLMNADLLLVSTHKEAVVPRVPFPRVRLTQAKAHPQVEAGYPIYLEEIRAVWKNKESGREYPILVFGVDPNDPVFLIPEVESQLDLLKTADTALIDEKSKEQFYGRRAPGVEAELGRRKIQIVGTFPLGADFRVDGNAIVSITTLLKIFSPQLPPSPGETPGTRNLPLESKIDFGLIKLRKGANLKEVQESLRDTLPKDVRVLTKSEFMDSVKIYWGTSKPVGYVFGLGTVVGFLIGVTICYQILYTDILDHLPQFATLKAIGYDNRYLVGVVLREAVYLALLGFLPGLLASLLVYGLLENVSGILMQLTVFRVLLVFVLTILMCVVSALIAVRRVMSSDPADVF